MIRDLSFQFQLSHMLLRSSDIEQDQCGFLDAQVLHDVYECHELSTHEGLVNHLRRLLSDKTLTKKTKNDEYHYYCELN